MSASSSALVPIPAAGGSGLQPASKRRASGTGDKASSKRHKKETSRERRERAKKKKSLYHLSKGDVPAAAQGLKRAFERHIQLLAGLHSQEDIMPKPSAANLARFDERFRTKDAVLKARNGPSLLEARFMFDIKALRNRISAYNSTIARDHMRVEDRHVQEFAVILSRYGFNEFCPDFTQSPYALFNHAHRQAATDTFKHALAAGCYVDFEPDLSYMHDTNFLWRIYDNAIHDHHFSRHEQDRINPGSVAQNIANGVIYKRRETLGERRGNFLRSCGYPMRVVKLVEDPECVSDDEVDYDENGHKFYDVKDKKYRSARVTSFIKWIDKCILLELAAKGQKQRGREARLRIRSKTPTVAAITTLPPPGVPIDYFDVIAFNAFPPSIRAQYAVKPLVALPESDQLAIQSPAKWKAYSDEEFMLVRPRSGPQARQK
ncbi:hypothetical protein EXIGLDRAFT_696918 [Exidia glandulosa HHB12029]|uniref:Uncharacterized protein n=1 Tax=Exidia glandulosa HHB12029 TaxID=1314781 RepID=A0A165F1B5_EXIGL|nr:hypothetical protein EXIGLDRAFT_696918 [Exidia glandulosa HHB12029]